MKRILAFMFVVLCLLAPCSMAETNVINQDTFVTAYNGATIKYSNLGDSFKQGTTQYFTFDGNTDTFVFMTYTDATFTDVDFCGVRYQPNTGSSFEPFITAACGVLRAIEPELKDADVSYAITSVLSSMPSYDAGTDQIICIYENLYCMYGVYENGQRDISFRYVDR